MPGISLGFIQETWITVDKKIIFQVYSVDIPCFEPPLNMFIYLFRDFMSVKLSLVMC